MHDRNRYRWDFGEKPAVTPGFWIGMRNSLLITAAFVAGGLLLAELLRRTL